MGSRWLLTGSLLLAGLGVSVYAVLHTTPGAGSLAALVAAGVGVGAAFAAASSTIMDSAPPERAGMAASLEEVSIELGGAMGVTLMGSLLAGMYSRALVLPAGLAVPENVRDSLDEALIAAEHLPGAAATALADAGRLAFDHAFVGVLAVAAVLLLVTGAVLLAGSRAAVSPAARPAVSAGR